MNLTQIPQHQNPKLPINPPIVSRPADISTMYSNSISSNLLGSAKENNAPNSQFSVQNGAMNGDFSVNFGSAFNNWLVFFAYRLFSNY